MSNVSTHLAMAILYSLQLEVICVSGNDRDSHLHEYDWRFTFASAEADLFHYHSDKKALKLSYVILKFLIKNTVGRRTGLATLPHFHQVCKLINAASFGILYCWLCTKRAVMIWVIEIKSNVTSLKPEASIKYLEDEHRFSCQNATFWSEFWTI